MALPMTNHALRQTPSQTVGPYFAYGLTALQYSYPYSQVAGQNLILNPSVKGERITIDGSVFDGDGEPITDALVEIWQADAAGVYGNPNFMGFGRAGTGDDRFVFETIKPGRIGGAAPHVNVMLFMRGLLVHAFTRIYFSDESSANFEDEVLKSVVEERRDTLLAKRLSVNGNITYHFDIHMQGPVETVFFDV